MRAILLLMNTSILKGKTRRLLTICRYLEMLLKCLALEIDVILNTEMIKRAQKSVQPFMKRIKGDWHAFEKIVQRTIVVVCNMIWCRQLRPELLFSLICRTCENPRVHRYYLCVPRLGSCGGLLGPPCLSHSSWFRLRRAGVYEEHFFQESNRWCPIPFEPNHLREGGVCKTNSCRLCAFEIPGVRTPPHV